MISVMPKSGNSEYSYTEQDKLALFPEYPSPDEYDFESIHFRSETRRWSRNVYENGFNDRRRINHIVAMTATEILKQHYNEINDIITISTTRFNEKVIIKDKTTNIRDPQTIGSFVYDIVRNLPSNGGKRHFCNCFRDEMLSAVYKTITEVHKLLAGLGIPQKQI